MPAIVAVSIRIVRAHSLSSGLTIPNASAVRDVFTSFILSCLCDGSRFNHMNRLREDSTLCELFGLKKIVGDDAVRRLFRQIGTRGDWIALASRLLWQAAPDEKPERSSRSPKRRGLAGLSQFWHPADRGAEATIEWMEQSTQSRGGTTSHGLYWRRGRW